MTSTTTGLPDRYRPLDQVGPDEPTPTGVIRCWRAKDRVLNRDVAIRVHTPGGPAAHAWIARALTAGGLATPALAMVYDAAEGSGDPEIPGSAAYVVNEWIDGETLAERLARGPMPEREARTVFRRLAEGVAEAHRVGLAVGGLTPDHVVLRPNGLVGLRGVPAATGTVAGDVAALGGLLEACLTGSDGGGKGATHRSGDRAAPSVPPDLAALIRRAKSTEPGRGLSGVDAMVALLADRPRAAAVGPSNEDADSGWLRRLRERRPAPGDGLSPRPPEDGTRAVDAPPVPLDSDTLPPVPPARPVAGGSTVAISAPAGALAPGGGHTDHRTGPGTDSETEDGLTTSVLAGGGFGLASDDGAATTGVTAAEEHHTRRKRRLVVSALAVLALVVVVGIGWWFGNNVLSVADQVDGVDGSTPAPTASSGSSPEAPTAAPVTIADAEVYDPFGDGEPENDPDVPLSYDGDPRTAWSTVTYRGSAAFGNLKEGVGVLYDLGSEQNLAGATLTTTTPGATVEVRSAGGPDGELDSYPVIAGQELGETTELTFEGPVTTRYVLVWVTNLVPVDGGFSADLAEVAFRTAG